MTLLNAGQRAKVRELEASFPHGRLLQGWELCRIFRLELGEKKDYQLAAMGVLLQDWSRQNWKDNQIDEKLHETRCAGTPAGQWCQCHTAQQDVWEWDEYVAKHWHEPIPSVKDSLIHATGA